MSVALVIAGMGTLAVATLFNVNLQQMRAISTARIGKKLEDEVKYHAAAKAKEYLDRVSQQNCDPTRVSFDDFINRIPSQLDSGVELKLLNKPTIEEYMAVVGTSPREQVRLVGEQQHMEAISRCLEGGSGLQHVPVYQTNHQPPYNISAADFQESDNLYFCLWLRPMSAEDQGSLGILPFAFVEARFYLKNTATDQKIRCRDLRDSSVQEAQATPFLNNFMLAIGGYDQDGDGRDSLDLAWNQTNLQSWRNSVSRARMGYLNYTLHWITEGAARGTNNYGRARGVYSYNLSRPAGP